jgi:hydroxypyruvate reductase
MPSPTPEIVLRRHARRIFSYALAAADPAQGILRSFRWNGSALIGGGRVYRPHGFRRIIVLGAGKASAKMGVGFEKLLGGRISDGLINTKYGHLAKLRRIRLNECSHPVPDDAGVRGATEIGQMAADATGDDLVVCLISGGASALLPLPAPGISLEEKQAVTGLLLACGADIHEINTVRKHISAIKGGRLAALAFPATVLSLILSDVVGDDLDVIGSGLTAPDRTTSADAIAVIAKYNLLDRIPPAIRGHLLSPASETPKPSDPAFERTHNLIIGSNGIALDAAAREAKALGYRTMILSSSIAGETRDVAGVHAAIAREIAARGRPVQTPACILSGGETTVTIRGNGKGGRNQEFALAAAPGIAGLPRTLIFSAGTDGTDGPTDAAGAVCDGDTIHRASKHHLDDRAHLADNDSYTFFDSLGDLIRTGPTGTNVMDIRIILAGKAPPD